MNKNVKRTLLAVMVSSMLAASFSAIPVAADGDSVVTPPPPRGHCKLIRWVMVIQHQ